MVVLKIYQSTFCIGCSEGVNTGVRPTLYNPQYALSKLMNIVVKDKALHRLYVGSPPTYTSQSICVKSDLKSRYTR